MGKKSGAVCPECGNPLSPVWRGYGFIYAGAVCDNCKRYYPKFPFHKFMRRASK